MRTDLLSAALRHARDARHLIADHGDRSVDQAVHLAGFAPECALKACLSDKRWDKSLGHDLGDDAVNFALALDPRASRIVGGLTPRLVGWNVEVRYARTGTTEADTANALVEAASRAVDQIVVRAWLDGLLGEVPA